MEVDLNKAHDLYQRAADLGDSLAKNYLGSFYFNHSKEYEKAVNLFRQASDCARAQNNLGLCFEQGLGKAVQDYHQAIKLYELSADQQNDQAMTNLGYLYFKMATQGLYPFTHQGTKQVMDQDELYFQSATWLRRALFTNENNAEALFLMAKLYEEGYSVDVNPELSQKYYERAGE